MFFILEAIAFIAFYILITRLQMPGDQYGSDACSHIGLINDIRNNGHKFVKYRSDIIGGQYFAYPQLYHWILSFLSSAIIEKYYQVFSIVIGLLQIILFLIFAYTIYPFIQIGISLEQFMLFSGIIFMITPFSYAIWNAKNMGISARGFGLLFGQIYLYLILWYYLFDNIVFFLAAFFIGFIIIISSQFAMQFVLFSAPLFALFFKNLFFLFIPVCALLIFYLIMPEIARNFIKGQINHKTLYYKYLAEKYILRQRYSIWRDFVWDFWVKIRTDFKRSVLYIYYNPLVTVIIGFPFFTLFVLYFVFDKRVQELVFSDKNIGYLIIPVVVSFLIFFFTSFRKTRFLGEPERYIEFCIPQISVLGAILFCYSSSIAYMVLGGSFLLVIGQFIMRLLKIKYGRGKQRGETVSKVLEILSKINGSDTNMMRIFSNNGDINKRLQVGNWKVLRINVTSLYTGQFHIKDIYTQYPYISSRVILPLIKEFEIGWFVLDTNILPNYDDILEDDDTLLKEEIAVDNCRIFRVCSKN